MGFFDMIADYATKTVRGFVKDARNDFLANVFYGIKKAQHYFLRQLMSVVLLLAAIIFLAVGLLYFFIDYIAVGRTIAFLIVGVLVLVIGLIQKTMSQRGF